MNNFFQENRRGMLILVGALFVLAIVLYLVLLHPLLGEIKRVEQNLTNKEIEKEALEHNLEDLSTVTTVIDIAEIEHKKSIPLQSDLDEYILTLQELELTTRSKINTINFAYDSSLTLDEAEENTGAGTVEDLENPLEEEEAEEEETAEFPVDEAESEDAEETEDGEEESDEPTIDPAILQEKPENLQVMTVRVAANSPTYNDFFEFIEAIEAIERISIVTSLNFMQADEADEFINEESLAAIPFEVEITTFYYDK